MGILTNLKNEYDTLGIDQQIDYGKLYLYSIVTHSTALEGSTVSETENRLLFDEGISSNKPMTEQLMNLDLKRAYEEGLKLASEHTDYSVEMLCALSALVMNNTGSEYKTALGDFDSAKGELRMINVSAGRGGKSYMAWQKVPDRLAEFCKWLNRERKAVTPGDFDSIYELSFFAHYNLVHIHPWADGNGRMSRLVMNMIQHEFNAVPSIVRKELRADYIDSLARSQEVKDPAEFIKFMTENHIDNMSQTIAEYKESLQDDTLYLINDTLNLSVKEKSVLDEFSKNSKATIEEVMNNTGFSRPTVTRAIKAMKEKGIVAREGAKKNGRWKILE